MFLPNAKIFINLNLIKMITVINQDAVERKFDKNMFKKIINNRIYDYWLEISYKDDTNMNHIPLTSLDYEAFNRQILFFNYDKG